MCEKTEAKIHEENPGEIMCSPRILTDKQLIESARHAIERNPMNSVNMVMAGRALLADGVDDAEYEVDPLRLALLASKYWGRDPRLTVGFLGRTPPDLIRRIMSHLNAWGHRGSGIQFVYTRNTKAAQVRINRERHNDARYNGYWSYLGTDIELYEGPYGQTMNLQGFTMGTPESEYKRVVRHEAGHALGFNHEHKRSEILDRINHEKAYEYYKRTNGWNKSVVDAQVLSPLTGHHVSTPFADPSSIMAYRIPSSILNPGAQPVPGGNDINDYDYDFVRQIY